MIPCTRALTSVTLMKAVSHAHFTNCPVPPSSAPGLGGPFPFQPSQSHWSTGNIAGTHIWSFWLDCNHEQTQLWNSTLLFKYCVMPHDCSEGIIKQLAYFCSCVWNLFEGIQVAPNTSGLSGNNLRPKWLKSSLSETAGGVGGRSFIVNVFQGSNKEQ